MDGKEEKVNTMQVGSDLSEGLGALKLCVFCEHMAFDCEDRCGGGCDTCGYGADEGRNDMVCGKGYWKTGIAWGLTKYREKIRAAETCPDYKQVSV